MSTQAGNIMRDGAWSCNIMHLNILSDIALNIYCLQKVDKERLCALPLNRSIEIKSIEDPSRGDFRTLIIGSRTPRRASGEVTNL